MEFSKDIESFIKDYIKDLKYNSASLFAGAGLSKSAGFVNWSELLKEIADDLGLNIDIEYDLLSIAQYHVNETMNKSKLNRKILEEFIEDIDETENHKIIARLPISSIWTTNYDLLIEKSLEKANKIVDVKINQSQLLNNKPKRDSIVYKMHGDVNFPSDAILTKEQYENYHQTHEPFISALSGELMTKTFLFLGFSFTDPNLDYVLSRLNYRFRGEKRQHYCILKKPILGEPSNENKASFDYNTTKQKLKINDLKRYGIKTLLIDKYSEITEILREIETRYKKETVFISGSAEEYGELNRQEAQNFIHLLSKKIIENNFKIVNGFGWGVGSSVINGALEPIYESPNKYSEDQLIVRPFPQFQTGKKGLKDLWEEYRQRMISLSGISIFLFGNKLNENGDVIDANGVIREFEISIEQGGIPIPIGFTGYASKDIYTKIIENAEKYYKNPKEVLPFIKELSELQGGNALDKIEVIIKLLKIINK